MRRRFELSSGLALDVSGPRLAVRHFEAEYGGVAAVDPGGAVLRLSVGWRGDVGTGGTWTWAGGHRIAAWRVAVSGDPASGALEASVRVRGPLAITLAQSLVIEPLLSLLAPAVGRVLLPAALLEAHDGMVLILGPSGSGKSTLSLRALAAGRRVAADDQVLVAADGRCAGLPRRTRVYPDLSQTAPAAAGELSGVDRLRLRGAGALHALTGGRVAPPTLVAPRRVGGDAAWPGRDVRPVRIVLIERAATSTQDGMVRPATPADVAACAAELLRRQREHLATHAPDLARATAAREDVLLGLALERIPAHRALLPSGLDAGRAVDVLGRLSEVAR